MTMKFVNYSSASKTRGIAITYRAGSVDNFGTCPSRCKLCPVPKNGTTRVDPSYLETVYKSVPKGGKAFSYTHFEPSQWYRPTTNRETTINYSTESRRAALAAASRGIPTVLVGRPDQTRVERASNGVRMVPCPAVTPAGEKRSLSCAGCGGNKGPLCWRADRDYIIVFPAHGSSKRIAADNARSGGCYANNFRAKMNWDNTRKEKRNDESQLFHWSQSLPVGSILRHHVAGDIGKDNTRGE